MQKQFEGIDIFALTRSYLHNFRFYKALAIT